MRRSGLLAVAAIVVMSLSFLMLGLFLLLTVNLRHAVHLAQERVEIAAYLEEDVSPAAAAAVADSLRTIPGVKEVGLVSKEEAFERFTQELGGDAALLECLDGNPLQACLEIALYDDFKTPQGVSSLADRVRSLPGVENVDSGVDWVEQLNQAITIVAILDLVFGLVVVFATVVSIGSTIKLALLARREVIQILKLVGATGRFIRAPFLIEGIIEGGVAAGIAAGLLWGCYVLAASFLPDLRFLDRIAIGVFVAAGSILGGFGALVSVRGLVKEDQGWR